MLDRGFFFGEMIRAVFFYGKCLPYTFDRIAVGENPMKEIEKRPGMDPEIIRMMDEASKLEAPELD